MTEHRRDTWAVDHREAVQDMRLPGAVDYLLDVLDRIVIPGDAAVAWEWPGAHMTASQKRLVYALASARHGPVSRDALWQAIRSRAGVDDAPSEGKSVDVLLSGVRPLLARSGVRVVNSYGMGWRLDVPPGFVWPWLTA